MSRSTSISSFHRYFLQAHLYCLCALFTWVFNLYLVNVFQRTHISAYYLSLYIQMVALNLKGRYQVSIILLFCVQTNNEIINMPHMNIINLSFQLLFMSNPIFIWILRCQEGIFRDSIYSILEPLKKRLSWRCGIKYISWRSGQRKWRGNLELP